MRIYTLAIIAFVIGLFVGTGIALSGFFKGSSEESVDSVRASEEWLANEAMLLDRIRDKDAEIARLKAELERALAVVEEPLAGEIAPEPPVEAEAEEATRPRFMDRMEERMGRRAGDMAARYGLTDEQAEKLKSVFMARFEAFRARRQGEETEPFSLDDAVAEVLTDEQFEQYLQDSQQEIYERAELMATTQLVRLNQRMELAPEVQDEVYETIHYAAQEMMIARQTGEDFDMRQVVDERLGTILSEEQMQTYQEIGTRGPGMGRGPGGGLGPGP